MTRVLVLSGRSVNKMVVDCCALDFETCFVDALEADLHDVTAGPPPRDVEYDLVVASAINFRKLGTMLRGLDRPRARHVIGFVFGGYDSHTARFRNPLRRAFDPRFRAYRMFDRMFVGIPDVPDKITRNLDLPTAYMPMGADVHRVNAMPYAPDSDRPIAVVGFGRVHRPTANLLIDRMNRPGSPDIFTLNTASGVAPPLPDPERYRALFWQNMRQARLSLAYDQFYANNMGRAEYSYIGPRWLEALAAGAVVIGKAPQSEDRRILLDWEDATIDLSDDAALAVDEIYDLLADPARLQAASRANLVQMHRRHDWRHRIAGLLDDLGLARPAKLDAQLEALSRRADALAHGRRIAAAE